MSHSKHTHKQAPFLPHLLSYKISRIFTFARVEGMVPLSELSLKSLHQKLEIITFNNYSSKSSFSPLQNMKRSQVSKSGRNGSTEQIVVQTPDFNLRTRQNTKEKHKNFELNLLLHSYNV